MGEFHSDPVCTDPVQILTTVGATGCSLQVSQTYRPKNAKYRTRKFSDKVRKGPSRAKHTTESQFSKGALGTNFATTIAKRYGECSEMLVFLGNFTPTPSAPTLFRRTYQV